MKQTSYFCLSLLLLTIVVGCDLSRPTSTTSSEELTVESDEQQSAKSVTTAELLPAPESAPPSLQSQYKKATESDDPESLAELASLSQAIGFQLAQQRKDSGYDYLMQAAQLIRKAKEGGVAVPDEVLANFLYNEACGLARKGDVEGGISSLAEALELGFNDIQLAENDMDLDNLHSHPEFDKIIEDAYSKLDDRFAKKAAKELEAGETFDFDFQLMDMNGEEVALNDFQGKVMIVDIWGTWCPPCRAEVPSFVRLQEMYGDAGLQIVGINYERGSSDEEKIEKVVDFAESNGINYPCVMGTKEVQKQIPNFEGYPTTLFVDRSGIVRLKAVGLHEFEYLESIVKVLLNEQSASL